MYKRINLLPLLGCVHNAVCELKLEAFVLSQNSCEELSPFVICDAATQAITNMYVFVYSLCIVIIELTRTCNLEICQTLI